MRPDATGQAHSAEYDNLSHLPITESFGKSSQFGTHSKISKLLIINLDNLSKLEIAASALYLLAAPSTPDDAPQRPYSARGFKDMQNGMVSELHVAPTRASFQVVVPSVEQQNGRGIIGATQTEGPISTPTLAENGISYKQSSKAQKFVALLYNRRYDLFRACNERTQAGP